MEALFKAAKHLVLGDQALLAQPNWLGDMHGQHLQHLVSPSIHGICPLRKRGGYDGRCVEVFKGHVGRALANPPEEAPLRVGTFHLARPMLFWHRFNLRLAVN